MGMYVSLCYMFSKWFEKHFIIMSSNRIWMREDRDEEIQVLTGYWLLINGKKNFGLCRGKLVDTGSGSVGRYPWKYEWSMYGS